MKRFLTMVGGVALSGIVLASGCDDEAPAVAPSEPVVRDVLGDAREAVEVTGADWEIVGGNRHVGGLELTVDFDGERHDFFLARVEDGVTFELVDADDQSFGLFMGHDGERSQLAEWTDTDRLDIVFEELEGGRMAETYELNGVSRRWVRDAGGRSDDLLTREFMDLMPASNSLNGNLVGERLVAFISDPALPDELQRLGFVPDIEVDGLRIPDELMWTCVAAAACTAIKCTAGGLFNALCDTCAGATFICIILILAHYL